MRITRLSLSGTNVSVVCTQAELKFLKLLVFADPAALATHCRSTHHGGICPIVANFISNYRIKK